ncbi:hypothetical protein JRQ81_003767 [Phrynocephalus forsythii]|uniref:V-SNARE coiled-coil homology domain-containing protein n=1 Tax=Phrynocephalus forsythii TaxID=171643 RepID=A0A9Q0XMD1_9SAUR|nr:hypothetical protein JRQ81_003767 [Phrynocephalus forsythii]
MLGLYPIKRLIQPLQYFASLEDHQNNPVRSDPAQSGAPEAGQEGGENAGGPPGPPPNLTSNRRLQQTQAQVEEVVDIMRVNVDKVLERDQKLSELDERADALQAGAQVFESSAAALKRKYWWKNCKMMIMLGVICAIVVIAIALEQCWSKCNIRRGPVVVVVVVDAAAAAAAAAVSIRGSPGRCSGPSGSLPDKILV